MHLLAVAGAVRPRELLCVDVLSHAGHPRVQRHGGGLGPSGWSHPSTPKPGSGPRALRVVPRRRRHGPGQALGEAQPERWWGSTSKHRSRAHQARAPSPACHAQNAVTVAASGTCSRGARRSRSAHTCRWANAESRGTAYRAASRTSVRTTREQGPRGLVVVGRLAGDSAPEPRGRRPSRRRPGPRAAARAWSADTRATASRAGSTVARRCLAAGVGDPSVEHRLGGERVRRLVVRRGRRLALRPVGRHLATRARRGRAPRDHADAGLGERGPQRPRQRGRDPGVTAVARSARRGRPAAGRHGATRASTRSGSASVAPRRAVAGRRGRGSSARASKVRRTSESRGRKPSTTGTAARRSSGRRAVSVVVMATTVPGDADGGRRPRDGLGTGAVPDGALWTVSGSSVGRR